MTFKLKIGFNCFIHLGDIIIQKEYSYGNSEPIFIKYKVIKLKSNTEKKDIVIYGKSDGWDERYLFRMKLFDDYINEGIIKWIPQS